jgi:hypothetical protein
MVLEIDVIVPASLASVLPGEATDYAAPKATVA